MNRIRDWLRPPRNLLVLFLLLVCLPAATLISLGLRLLDQDRELAGKRQIELLEYAADAAVHVLQQDLAERQRLLENGSCTPVGDAVCLTVSRGRIDAVPAHRIPYYPRTRQLREMSDEPFREADAHEFREDYERALTTIHNLTVAGDPAIRAGALLRRARILRKMKRADDTLTALEELSTMASIAINGEPADLTARRMRCSILEEQAWRAALLKEASLLANDLDEGKWQLDPETFKHVDDLLRGWLGERPDVSGDREAFAAAAGWIHEKWADEAASKGNNVNIGNPHILRRKDRSLTILSAFHDGKVDAFVAGPDFMKSHWIGSVNKAGNFAHVQIVDPGSMPGAELPMVQRRSAEKV